MDYSKFSSIIDSLDRAYPERASNTKSRTEPDR